MKIAIKVVFASALMLSAAAPTLSHAAYFVDATKTYATVGDPTQQTQNWATVADPVAQHVMGKKVHVGRHALGR
jgi:hypothetical protein